MTNNTYISADIQCSMIIPFSLTAKIIQKNEVYLSYKIDLDYMYSRELFSLYFVITVPFGIIFCICFFTLPIVREMYAFINLFIYRISKVINLIFSMVGKVPFSNYMCTASKSF